MKKENLNREAIKVNNVKKSYKDVLALNNVSLSVNEGELFGLLGVNGAGKTTLIKILCGLTKKDFGHAEILGLDIDKDMEKIKSIVDLSPQETSIAPNLTVLENLKFFANIYQNYDQKYLNKIIEIFDLTDCLNKTAKKLSGGYQRRVSIACALISKPKILFLDEPTLGLDVIARKELWRVILKLKGQITIILTTHYLEEIEALCDRILIMSKGKVLAIGTSSEIKDSVKANNLEDAFVTIVKEDKHEKNVNLFE